MTEGKNAQKQSKQHKPHTTRGNHYIAFIFMKPEPLDEHDSSEVSEHVEVRDLLPGKTKRCFSGQISKYSGHGVDDVCDPCETGGSPQPTGDKGDDSRYPPALRGAMSSDPKKSNLSKRQ